MTLSSSSGVALLMGMGTGKSLVSVSLTNIIEAKRVLILCPVSVVGVWGREFDTHSANEFNVVPLRKTDRKTSLSVAEKADLARKALKSSKPTVIVTNYESSWRDPLNKLLLEQEWDLIIADEIHKIQNSRSKVSKYLYKLAPKAKYKLGLTGTEFAGSGSEISIFGQYKFLNETVFGTRFDSFKNRYFTVDAWGNPKSVLNKPDLKRNIDSISYRATDEVLAGSLPEAVHVTIDTPLSGAALKMYEEIEAGMWATLEEETDKQVIARVVIAQLTRCAQVTGGFVGGVVDMNNPDAEREVHPIKGSSKAQALEDILDGLDPSKDKVVVFCRFTAELQHIKEIAGSKGFKAGEISGQSKSGLNDESKFNEEYDLVAVQIQAGGVGIDLTASSKVIYWSKDFSHSNLDQSLKRAHRPGQKNKVTFYHLVTPNTIDERIQDTLTNKGDVVESYKAEARARQKKLFGS